MTDLLLDTDAVSILFKPAHALYGRCMTATLGHQLLISFMTNAELLLWPRRNKWGTKRADLLASHISLFTTLFPDQETCVCWADVVAESTTGGRPMGTADAWIAACARQWGLPLVTANFRDFEHLRELSLVPIDRP